MSVVVVHELVAGALDSSAIKNLKASYRFYEKENRVLVPTAEDWLLAGEVVNSLQQGRPSKHSGNIPKISAEEKYRITNDVLIARTAKRAGVTVVTNNIRDFEKIKKFCNVQLKRGPDHFNRYSLISI